MKDWKNKKLHGQFVKEKEEFDWNKYWQWIKKGDLTSCIEALVFSAQEKALRKNYIKSHIDNTIGAPLCLMFSEKGESYS